MRDKIVTAFSSTWLVAACCSVQAQGIIMAQNDKGQPIINQNVTSHNQSGGITAHTVNIGPQRLKFDPTIAEELAQKLPKDKPIRLRSVGGNSDHAVANEYQLFLQNRGFNIANRDVIGMMSPPPEHKISIMDAGAQVIIVIAPNAN